MTLSPRLGAARRSLPLLALALLALLALPAAHAQATAQIQGVLTDRTGAAVPGVSVLATNTATGTTRLVTTGADGRFLLPSLPPGSYSLRYVKSGFTTTTVAGITLQIGSDAVRHDVLQVAAQQTTVEVSGVAPPIDVTKSNVAGVVTSRQITQLPIANRQYLDLSLLMPGTTQDASRSFYNNVQLGGGGHYYSNSFTVDGVNNNWSEMGEPRQNIPEGAVQEFKVYTSQYAAGAGGMATGGAVAVVTKSGTNQFHGDAFEYFRNQALNRDNRFQQAAELAQHTGKAPLNRNQFGGDLGGPILKNKLHFFGSWESTLTRSSYTVFSNNPAIFGGFEGVFAQPSHDDLMNLRFDYQINSNQMLFARYSQEWNLLTCQGCGGSSAANAGYDGLIPRKSLVVGHTWQLTSNVVNDFRFQYARSAYLLAPTQCPQACGQGIWTALGQYPAERFLPYHIQLAFPDFSWGSDYGEVGIEHHYEYKDTMSILHGAHNIQYGFDIQYVPFADDGSYDHLGHFSFNTDPSQPLDPANAPNNASFSAANLFYPATGTTPAYGPTSFFQLLPPVTTSVPTADTNYFFNDNYTGIRNLNLSLGLVYDRQWGSFNEHINPAAFPQPVPFLGDPSKRGDANNFGPRLGLSWDMSGRGRDVLRAGYGIYYGNIQTLQNFAEDRNFAQQEILITCSKPGQASCPTYPDATGPAVTILPTVTVLAPNFQNPYSEQYNLGYSREISPNFSLNVDGVYQLTLRDYKVVDLNYPVNGVRPLPQFNQIQQHDPIYKSKYKALYVRADKRFSKNYQFLLSYTLSSCLGNGAQSAVNNYSDWSLDWGPCNIDRRQALVASSSYQAPWGITLGAIFSLRSSPPFSAFSTSRNADGTTQYVAGTSRNQGRRGLDFSAVNAYRTSLGLPDVAASDVANERVNEMDLRASRSFSLGEQRQLQVIGQVFNMLGTYNYTDVTTNLRSLSWGQPTGAGPLQQAELAVKFSF